MFSFLFPSVKIWALFSVFILPVLVFSQAKDAYDLERISESTKNKYEIESIVISGNKKTQNKIIFRELNFRAGDVITENELRAMEMRSQQNLINTSLFIFVTIGHDIIDNKISVHIDVKERWYVWPTPIFEIQDRNFNTWWKTKDMFRANYGMYLTFENMFGLNQSLSIKFRKGYTENYGVSYKIPFLNKKQTIGMSVGYLFSRNNEIAYNTYGNQLQFFRSYTKFMRSEQEAKLGFSYRDGLYTKHNFELAYHSSEVADTIAKLNPNYYAGDQSKIQYFSVVYNIKHDLRDNRIYPLKGYIAYLSVAKDGLALLKNENVDNFSIHTGLSRYWNFAPRFYWANHVRVRYSSVRTPYYYFNRALGWGNDLVRGYEYYVVDGQSYAMFKSNIRYQLVKPRVYHAKWLKGKLDKFNKVPYALYVSGYADAAYVEDKKHFKDNPLSNSFLLGGGIGLDFVTYYDYVLRVEFSVNQLQQKGLF
ncbi:MAG: hypothetical protein IAF38_09385, partial [Bacteroidia bacterium]|nr:hypothetical protein [Bacteroidia bacterium]